MVSSGTAGNNGSWITASGALMLKYVWALGGLGGLIVSLLMMSKFGHDVEGINLFIFSPSDIYRYDVSADELSQVWRQPSWDQFYDLGSTSLRTSPDGLWMSITYDAAQDEVYIINSIFGTLTHTVKFSQLDMLNRFETWSPDSQFVGWFASETDSHPGLLVLDVNNGERQHFRLPDEDFVVAQWKDDHTIGIETAARHGSYFIDIYSGRMWFEENVNFPFRGECCGQAIITVQGISMYYDSEIEFLFETNAIEAQASFDMQKIVYLEPVDVDKVNIFVYDRQKAESKQITTTPFVSSCVNLPGTCLAFETWSPDRDWILLHGNSEIRLININSGDIRTVTNIVGYTTWADIKLPDNRDHAPFWILTSAVFLLFGLWGMVR